MEILLVFWDQNLEISRKNRSWEIILQFGRIFLIYLFSGKHHKTASFWCQHYPYNTYSSSLRLYNLFWWSLSSLKHPLIPLPPEQKPTFQRDNWEIKSAPNAKLALFGWIKLNRPQTDEKHNFHKFRNLYTSIWG